MPSNSVQDRWSNPFLWLMASFGLTFFIDLGSYTPQFMALSMGSLVFLGSYRPSLILVFLFAFFCDVAFHRPFGFHGMIFLAEIALAARFRYRFCLANPFVQALSVLGVSFCIQLYEVWVFSMLHRSVTTEYFLGGCLSSGVLWPVYARLSQFLRTVEPLRCYE